MSFITQQEAESILGADFAPDGDKARLISLANIWMKNEVKPVPNPVDPILKEAACEIIKGIQAKAIYAGVDRETTREMVDAGGVKSDETYTDGSVAISKFEQIARAMISSINPMAQGFTIPVRRG